MDISVLPSSGILSFPWSQHMDNPICVWLILTDIVLFMLHTDRIAVSMIQCYSWELRPSAGE